MMSLRKIHRLYLEQVNLHYAYLSTTIYTQVLKQPSILVKHRRCEGNLPKSWSATSIATWNVRTLNEEGDFKLQNLLSEIKRQKLEILDITKTHRKNETAKVFEYNDFVIIHSSRNDDIQTFIWYCPH